MEGGPLLYPAYYQLVLNCTSGIAPPRLTTTADFLVSCTGTALRAVQPPGHPRGAARAARHVPEKGGFSREEGRSDSRLSL